MTATISAPGVSTPPPEVTAPAGGSPEGPGGQSATGAAPGRQHALIQNRNVVIDGIRGIAAISVVFGHTVLINQLIFSTSPRNAIFSFLDSLPFFFAVSGLMNYRRFVLGALTGKVPQRRSTVANRLWRILPAYYLIVIAVWAMRFANSPADWQDLALHVTFLQTWSPTYVFWLDGPSWFLANDLQFFLLTTLLAPFVTQLALRIAMTRSGTVKRMLVMFAFPLLLFIAGCADIWFTRLHHHDAAAWVRYTPIYTLSEYAAGMMLAVFAFTPGVIRVRPLLGYLFMAVGFGCTAVVNYFEWHVLWVNAYEFPLVAMSLCIVVAGALMVPQDGRFAKLFNFRPLQFMATVGLTVLLVQEPLEIALEHWGLMNTFSPLACWVSATLLTIVSGVVAWLLMRLVEEPAMALRAKIRKVKTLETGRDRRHRGPIPRMLPDIALSLPGGEQVSVRSAVGDRPLLLAFGDAGTSALAEQQFRINSGESRALHIATAFDRSCTESELLGAEVAFDPDGGLARALNIPVALVEVGPDGLITAFQRSRREAFGAWT